MTAVVGISTSSRERLDRQLDALGTNLLTAGPGSTLFGAPAKLPEDAVGMVGRIDGVESVSAIGTVGGAKVYRSDRVPVAESGGIGVYAALTNLPGTAGATVAAGARAADRMGIGEPRPDLQIWLGGRWFTVIGVLDPVPLAPELDLGALIGWPAARSYLNFDGRPTTIYTRTDPNRVEAVRVLLARTANPAQPNEVDVSRPSDALAARAAVNVAFTGLLLGVGGVALLVGGIGVANTMVISVR